MKHLRLHRSKKRYRPFYGISGKLVFLLGFAALADLAGTAILAPEVFAASMLTGEGTLLAASITSEALYLISIGC